MHFKGGKKKIIREEKASVDNFMRLLITLEGTLNKKTK